MQELRFANLMIAMSVLSFSGIAKAAHRDVQIRSVNFNTGVIELFNFGPVAETLTGWQFCTFDDDQVFQYSSAGALSGRFIMAGESFFIHTLNDAPGAMNAMNVSALGPFALPISSASFAMSLYDDSTLGFVTPSRMVDHVMWSIGGVNVGLFSRADIAVAAGLWTAESDYVNVAADASGIELTDDSGGLLHGPADYQEPSSDVPNPPDPAPVMPGNLSIRLLPVLSGLTSAVDLTHASDGSGRLYVVLQTGTILIIESDGTVLPQPFLDLTATIPTLNAGFDERGLLGITFHPDFANNRRYFVRYSAPRVGDPAEPCVTTSRGCHEEILAEFTANSATDGNIASQRILFRVDEPEFNHNSGSLAFGPDGLLYWGQGDGGGANDQVDEAIQTHGPTGNGQNIETALGSILRIDVDSPPDVGLEYKVPLDNPFVGVTGVDEIFAYGMRNPFKISFDDGPGGSGELYVADVGQNRVEEVDIVTNGNNYGWVTREGNQCFDPFNAGVPLAACPDTGPFGEPLVGPIAEYSHADGISIIGGFVHRGSEFPGLNGLYVFGDFSTSFGSPDGRLFYFDADGDPSDIFEFINGPNDDPVNQFIKGFGEDANGEVYLLSSTALAPFGTGASVFKIVPVKGDINGSGAVDLADVPEFVNVLLGSESDPSKVERADINDLDGANGADIALFLGLLL